ncbi:MAG: hypothetical protein ACOCQH_01530 [Halanaerobiales bacterium]
MFFTEEKAKRYLEDLKNYIYQSTHEITEFELYPGELSGVYRVDFDKNSGDKITIGQRWGGENAARWFRTTLEVCPEWRRENKVVLYFDLGTGHQGGLSGAESLIYINGEPVCGLDINHREVHLKKDYLMNEELLG